MSAQSKSGSEERSQSQYKCFESLKNTKKTFFEFFTIPIGVLSRVENTINVNTYQNMNEKTQKQVKRPPFQTYDETVGAKPGRSVQRPCRSTSEPEHGSIRRRCHESGSWRVEHTQGLSSVVPTFKVFYMIEISGIFVRKFDWEWASC